MNEEKTIEAFCEEHQFVYHKTGYGRFGARPYWSYYRVENNDRTLFTIEYYPRTFSVMVKTNERAYNGRCDNLSELFSILEVCRIDKNMVGHERKTY